MEFQGKFKWGGSVCKDVRNLNGWYPETPIIIQAQIE